MSHSIHQVQDLDLMVESLAGKRRDEPHDKVESLTKEPSDEIHNDVGEANGKVYNAPLA